MDPMIAKRLKTAIVVHPRIGQKRGDIVYGTPYLLMGYINYREKMQQTDGGDESNFYTVLYFDGKVIPPEVADRVEGFINRYGEFEPLSWDGEKYTLDNGEIRTLDTISGILQRSEGKPLQYANIKSGDMVELPGQGKIPVTTVKSYQGLVKGTQNVEVIL